MSELGLVIAIALPISLILAGLVWLGRRQQNQQSQRLQARAIKQSAEDLLEALEFLLQIDNFREVQLLVLERVGQLYALYAQTLPKADSKQSETLFDPEPYKQRIEEGKGNRRVFKSDREVRLARRYIGKILKTLTLMQKRRELSEAALLEYRRYLRLTLLEREVDTYTAQGDVAADRGDVITATNYYKAAKKLLIEFDLQYPEKNERIRELSQRTAALYNGERIKTSENLAAQLSKELDAEHSPFGIPANPLEKRKF